MKLFSRIRKLLPKRLAAVAAAAFAVVALPVMSASAANVRMEGSMGVANVTAGDTQYTKSVNATYDQVVKVQFYYHNREDENSGKVANDLRMKFNVPTTAGTNQVISGSISSPDIDTINDSVAVNLNRADARLSYIPGSATWKHNAGTNDNVQIVEQKLSDEIVYGGTGIVVEDVKPCFNFDATVTILVRVQVPGITIDKYSRVKGSTEWSKSNTAKPGDTLQYRITYQNMGNTTHNNVVIRDNLPPKMQYVPGTTYLYNTTNPGGVKYNSDNITNGGIVIGNYTPGANAHVTFEVKVPTEDQLACGPTLFTNVGVVRPEGMNEFYNTADTTVTKVCQPSAPTYSCDLLKIEKTTGREIKVSEFKTSQANGATFKNVVINWGDNTTPLTTNNAVGQKHTYAADGTYTVIATATFTVNGADKTATSEACKAVVTFSTTPTTPTTPGKLPNTGAGDVVGIFAAVTVAGAVAHRYFLGRQYS